MQIHVASRCETELLIKKLGSDGSTVALISVTDPGEPLVCGDFCNALRLQFHDLDRIWPQLNEVVYFDEHMADSIVRFVKHNISIGSDHLIVQCEAGVARSPAIAAAIYEHLHMCHAFFKTHIPNTMVFTILRSRFGF